MTAEKGNLFTLTPLNFKESKTGFDSEAKSINISECVERYDPLTFCRTCANVDSCLVPIFKEEGLNYSLNKKIEKYLPIQVSEEDGLPIHLCYHCASTLIAWDTLVIGCVEAEKKLTLLKNSLENKQCEEAVDDVSSLLNDHIDSDDEPLLNKKTSARLTKNNEKRDILQEKNDLQILKPAEIETERFMEEPDLSFSTFQLHISMGRPLIFEILNLRIDSPFCCNICAAIKNLKFSYLSSIKKLKGQTSSKSDNYNSDNNSVISETSIKSRKCTKSKSRVTCEQCGKILSCKMSLKNHMRTHCEEKTLTCHVCGRAFRHRFNLLRHLRVIHEGIRNHVCVDCGKKYRSHGEMEDHRNVHSIREKIICEECGRTFLTKASFYAHRKSHRIKKSKPTSAQFNCEKCNKKFTTKKSRNQHLLIHSGEKPIVCTVCGKNFRTKANFSQHAKVHSDFKPFSCEHCGKTFGRKDHLRIHVRCHTGEKPFVCNYCGKGFAQMNDMKKHSKIHKRGV